MTELSGIEGSQSLRILRLYHAYRIIVGLVLGVPVAVISALVPGSWIDRALRKLGAR